MFDTTVKELREDLGVRQSDLADMIGVTRQTYSKLEQEPWTMSVGDARKIATYMADRVAERIFGVMVMREGVPANASSQGRD